MESTHVGRVGCSLLRPGDLVSMFICRPLPPIFPTNHSKDLLSVASIYVSDPQRKSPSLVLQTVSIQSLGPLPICPRTMRALSLHYPKDRHTLIPAPMQPSPVGRNHLYTGLSVPHT